MTADLVDHRGFHYSGGKTVVCPFEHLFRRARRKVNAFKERESAANRPVRGRQASVVDDGRVFQYEHKARCYPFAERLARCEAQG